MFANPPFMQMMFHLRRCWMWFMGRKSQFLRVEISQSYCASPGIAAARPFFSLLGTLQKAPSLLFFSCHFLIFFFDPMTQAPNGQVQTKYPSFITTNEEHNIMVYYIISYYISLPGREKLCPGEILPGKILSQSLFCPGKILSRPAGMGKIYRPARSA
jgi:hypothetical protein